MNNNEKNFLEEIENIMMEELRFYEDKDKTINAKSQRLSITDRMVKSANIILGVENLKERQYMNRTERKKENRQNTKKV